MAVKLYVIPGSHPSKAAELMLEHKGIPFKRVDLVTAMHRPALKLLGFPRQDGSRHEGRRAQVPGHARDLARARRDQAGADAPHVRRGQGGRALGRRGAPVDPAPARLVGAAAPLRQAAHGGRAPVARRATGSGCRSASRRAPCSRSRRSRPATTTRPTRTSRRTSRPCPSKIDQRRRADQPRA